MQITFRWFGQDDPVTLDQIRQIPVVSGIVTALDSLPVGQVWAAAPIAARQEQIERAGFTWAVVESLPVHESIKLGQPDRERYLDAYCRSIENLGALGIPVLCYNFMPVFDWLRTDLALSLPDGSTTLAYNHADLEKIDFSTGRGVLPGWAGSYSNAEIAALLAAYRDVTAEQLWENLAYFLERVVPVAAAAGVRLAIHPDDPPWPVLGLPRIITNARALQRLTRLVPHPANGITFCTGSLAADPGNDLPQMLRDLGKRIHFVHARNIKRTGERLFHETAHPGAHGDIDLVEILKTLREIGFDGPLRPDHGRMLWGEKGRPGYGLYDRALGAMYLAGVWESLAKL